MPKDDPTNWMVIGEPVMQGKYLKVLCRCQCGREKMVNERAVKYRQSTSCGRCVNRNGRKKSYKHGGSGTVEYRIYHAILQRCLNPKCGEYHNYGGRGITVCARWQNSFAAFQDDLGRRPDSSLSIDRIENEQGYWCGKTECPDCGPAKRLLNCRWATDDEQSRNRRGLRWIVHDGKKQRLVDWAREHSIPANVLGARLNLGWSFEKAVSTPVAPYKKKPKPETS